MRAIRLNRQVGEQRARLIRAEASHRRPIQAHIVATEK
jgi:hypothetical protein